MSNLINTNKSDIQLVLNLDEYYDFFVHKGSDFCKGVSYEGNSLYDECLLSYIDFTDSECLGDKYVISLPSYVYEDAVYGEILKNIGFCGVDNGIIRFLKDRITNEEFIKIFTKSELKLDNDRLKLFEVSGNTKQYTYDLSYDENEGAILKGGFFQGFFMTECDKYKVLPTEIEDAWHFEVELKRVNYEDIDDKALNNTHPNNKGFFLYIGTRAENKWIYLYDSSLTNTCDTFFENKNEDDYLYQKEYERTDKDYINERNYIQKEIIHPYVIDGYFTEICEDKTQINIKSNSYFGDDYIKTENIDFSVYDYEKNCKDKGIVKVGSCNNISDECVGYLNYNKCCLPISKTNCSDNECCCNIPLMFWRYDYYGIGTSFKSMKENFNLNKGICGTALNGDWLADDAFDLNNEYCIIDCEYLKEDIDISDFDYETDEGVKLDLNEKLIKSDNKFLLFNRTCSGYDVNNWEEGSKVYISFPRQNMKENLFLIMNRTCSGKTVDDIETIIEPYYKKYDYKKDLYNNALGFRITDNGEIGYRYLTIDCDTNDIKIEEFYSKPLIEEGTWYTVNVKLKKFGNKMRIYIYLNGKLILCSKYLPLLKLRELNEEYSKQEGVPFNISVGGGTQGLCDVILPNFMEVVENKLPLEENFGGTFIGNIKDFRFYSCSMDYRGIQNNYFYNLRKIID